MDLFVTMIASVMKSPLSSLDGLIDVDNGKFGKKIYYLKPWWTHWQ